MNELWHTRELVRIGQEDLIKKAFGQTMPVTTPSEQINAWRTIMFLEQVKIDTEMKLGLYDRDIPATVIANPATEIPAEIYEQITVTYQKWGMPKGLTRKIESQTTKIAEFKELPTLAPVEAPVASQTPNPPIITPINAQPRPINNGIIADPVL